MLVTHTDRVLSANRRGGGFTNSLIHISRSFTICVCNAEIIAYEPGKKTYSFVEQHKYLMLFNFMNSYLIFVKYQIVNIKKKTRKLQYKTVL